jgi:hypothetical protein
MAEKLPGGFAAAIRRVEQALANLKKIASKKTKTKKTKKRKRRNP